MISELTFLIGLGVAVSFLAYKYYFKKGAMQIEEEPEIHVDVNLPQMLQQFVKALQGPSEAPKAITIERPVSKRNVPLQGACSNCKAGVTLPFKCKYCESLFCGDHRLPESHVCTGI